ncbi:glycosyltransferase 87 family protein [Flindersiella endophytica]
MTAESTDAETGADTGAADDSAQPATAPSFWQRWIVRRWLIGRGLTLLLLTFEYARVTGDVRYYFRSTGALLAGGAFDEVMREYPPLCVLFTTGLKLVFGIQQDVYAVSFLLVMIGIDVWFTRLLWRSSHGRKGAGIWVWLWFAPALGPIMYARLDLAAAVLAGAAVVLTLRRAGPMAARGARPVLAGLIAGLGFLVKLFPLVAMPALVLRRDGRWRLAGAFAATAVLGVAVTYVVFGGERTLSPLTWQSGRSLQIESLFALPLLVANVFQPGRWQSDYSAYLAVEVVGPGVEQFVTAATVGTGVAILVLAVLWFRSAFGGSQSSAAIGWLFVATICLMLVTNKVFSPQYLVWLAAALAALGVVADAPSVLRAGRLFLVTCVLTQIFYPTLYHRLYRMQVDMVVVITLRDAVLLLLTAVAIRQAWISGRRRVRVEPEGGS